MPLAPLTEKPQLVYTDARFTKGGRTFEAPVDGCTAAIAVVVYVRRTRCFHHAFLEITGRWLEWVFTHKEQYIGPLEALAAAAAYATFPDLLAGSLVLHFIDNQGTLAHVVSGSARDRDCSRIAHACSAATLRLRCRVWYEYVASAANISDLPTRDEFAMLRRLGSTARALVLPRLPLF